MRVGGWVGVGGWVNVVGLNVCGVIVVLFCFSVEVTESFYNGLCPEVTPTALTSVLSCDCMEGHSASCSATANVAGCESSLDGGKTAKGMELTPVFCENIETCIL